jgi:nucleoside-diphosphate-sugar epimerase
MRVLITGGYGFIGAWVAKQLLDRGDAVFSYDLREDPRRFRLVMNEDEVKRVAFVPGDVTDVAALDKAVKSNGITHILHLAGLQVPTCKADPLLGAKVNVLGTLAVFEAARTNKIERVVYASSAAVFGEPGRYPPGPQPDDAPLVPGTHYGVFKCCNEGNARIYFQDHGVVSVGLRPWTVYGPGRDLGMTSEPTKAIKAVMLGRPYAINFGGWTDFQYVGDTAGTFVNCLHRPYAGAKSYNCRGAVVTLDEYRRTLIRVLPEAEQWVTVGTTQIAICYDLSDDGLRRDLGEMPNTPLEAGIRETVRIFKQLRAEGRLDASELDAPKPPPVTVADEV